MLGLVRDGRRSISSGAASCSYAAAPMRPTRRPSLPPRSNAACRSMWSASTIRRSPRFTSSRSFWCGRMGTSPGARQRRRKIRWQLSIRCAALKPRGQGEHCAGASGIFGAAAGGVAHQREPLANSDPRRHHRDRAAIHPCHHLCEIPARGVDVPCAQPGRRRVAARDRCRHQLRLRLSRRRSAAFR